MTSVIQPGAMIGIIGGGQLGRMLALAAKIMGYRVAALDPDPRCSASSIVDRLFLGSFRDQDAAATMARECDVVTLEIEQVAIEVLQEVQRFCPVRPGSNILYIIQDRIRQKEWLVEHGFPIGPYRAVKSSDDVSRASASLGSQVFLKQALGGYDGRSQVLLPDSNEATLNAAWSQLGQRPCVAESAVPLESEISVMVSRSPQGEIKAFPPASNNHQDQILFWSVLPAIVNEELAETAQLLAIKIAEELSLEGCLAVEMFVASNGQLLVNELAPRPHNSYHASERACATSQFEQTIRAVCGLPLGDVNILKPSAIVNLLGDLWQEEKPAFDRVLQHSGIRLHLYEKYKAHKGRKMGHLSSIGDDSDDAVRRALLAYHELV